MRTGLRNLARGCKIRIVKINRLDNFRSRSLPRMRRCGRRDAAVAVAGTVAGRSSATATASAIPARTAAPYESRAVDRRCAVRQTEVERTRREGRDSRWWVAVRSHGACFG